MAFFDRLTFDPQGYSGQGGGILDLLRNIQTQQQYQPSAGFQPTEPQAQPIAIGDYMMPRSGPASLYEPKGDVLPQNAQPAMGQGSPVQPQEPNRLLTGLQGFLGNLHSGPVGALAGGVGALVTGQRTDPGGIAQQQANMTAQALVRGGLEPNLAATVARNPDLLKAVLPQILGIGGQTDDIKEYQFAKKEQPDLTFAKFMQQKKAVSGEYSLTPLYGTDKDGNTVIMQTGKSGEAIQTKLPEGVKPSSGVEKLDAGDKWIIYDKRTGTPLGTQPKDLASKEAAEKVGQARGTAQAALANGADIDAEQTKKKIDEFINHKGFNEVFGQLDQYRPSFTHSNEGADALARYKQLKGVTFLTAYQMLKGGGAITDIEGQKAGDAMARLDRAQSEDEAKQALRDFREAVDIGLQKLRRAAGGGEAPKVQAAPAASSAPGLPSGWTVKVN